MYLLCITVRTIHTAVFFPMKLMWICHGPDQIEHFADNKISLNRKPCTVEEYPFHVLTKWKHKVCVIYHGQQAMYAPQ